MAETKFIRVVSGIPRMQVGVPNISNQQTTLVGDITAGTPVTLPGGMTYTSEELEITLNGQRLQPTEDYTYVGSPPRTQVQYTLNLVIGDKLTYRTDRIP